VWIKRGLTVALIKGNASLFRRYVGFLTHGVGQLFVPGGALSLSNVLETCVSLSGCYQNLHARFEHREHWVQNAFGNFKFKVMPMGLCGALRTFQHLIDSCCLHHNSRSHNFLQHFCLPIFGRHLRSCSLSTRSPSHLRGVLTRYNPAWS
jgi:hypothetical protein